MLSIKGTREREGGEIALLWTRLHSQEWEETKWEKESWKWLSLPTGMGVDISAC